MGKAGSARSYKRGQKNNWRRRVWNEVLRRTAGREQSEVILYLAGSEDLDRQIAIDKGVPHGNLVAIDRSITNVDTIRADLNAAVHGDALDILWSWPDNRRVCAVLLDFCSGIEFGNLGIFDAFQRRALRSAVVVINFQRGRDPWSNKLREALRVAGLLKPLWREGPGGEPVLMLGNVNHRAFQFLQFHAWDTLNVVAGKGSTILPQSGGDDLKPLVYVDQDAGKAHVAFVAAVGLILGTMKPVFFEYKSGSLTFDSAVFESYARGMDMADLPWAPGWVLAMKAAAEKEIVASAKTFKSVPLIRRIGAMLAVRSKRAS